MATKLPKGMVWEERPFPNSNFLLLQGEEPTLIDSGFVAYADVTTAMVHKHAAQVTQVVNPHWHSDHVGANSLFQQRGATIIGSYPDAQELATASPDCCLAEYLDQPVPQYTINRSTADGDQLLLGDTSWQVLAVPGHTPGHLAIWNDEHRILAVGDTLSIYDVGWVNIMREGAKALDDAISSIRRLSNFDSRIILPGHGPQIDRPEQALAKAVKRLERERANVDRSVDYGAKRVLAFTLMIRGGMPLSELDNYLFNQHWARDAARTLETTTEDFIRTLINSMLST